MKTFLTAAFAALGLLVVAAACSGNGNKCENTTCLSPLLCDPADGLCKCGGAGGVVCAEGSSCDGATTTCQSSLCPLTKECGGGTSCDVRDGECKCGGTGGQVCGDGLVCNPSINDCEPIKSCTEVACPENQLCDAATGQCRCGTDTCAPGESCQVSGSTKSCTVNACAGVTCLGETSCDPADGYCKCNGALCSTGESCQCPAGGAASCEATARSCQPSSACANVACSGGTTCDPADGLCKCGGPGGPVCGADQLCNVTKAQCQGGVQCTLADGGAKACPAGLSCDPEDGVCKCGGQGGVVCQPATATAPSEVCVATATQNACRRPCSPTNPDCLQGSYCYFDNLTLGKVSYCSAPSDSKVEGQSCTLATDCFTTDPVAASMNCTGVEVGQSGLCRPYCDPANGPAGCAQGAVPQNCEPLGDAPSIGVCTAAQ